MLAGGFPCQPFSKSGAQRGMDEARGTLFWNICRVLEEHKPAVVLLASALVLAMVGYQLWFAFFVAAASRRSSPAE